MPITESKEESTVNCRPALPQSCTTPDVLGRSSSLFRYSYRALPEREKMSGAMRQLINLVNGMNKNCGHKYGAQDQNEEKKIEAAITKFTEDLFSLFRNTESNFELVSAHDMSYMLRRIQQWHFNEQFAFVRQLISRDQHLELVERIPALFLSSASSLSISEHLIPKYLHQSAMLDNLTFFKSLLPSVQAQWKILKSCTINLNLEDLSYSEMLSEFDSANPYEFLTLSMSIGEAIVFYGAEKIFNWVLKNTDTSSLIVCTGKRKIQQLLEFAAKAQVESINIFNQLLERLTSESQEVIEQVDWFAIFNHAIKSGNCLIVKTLAEKYPQLITIIEQPEDSENLKILVGEDLIEYFEYAIKLRKPEMIKTLFRLIPQFKEILSREYSEEINLHFNNIIKNGYTEMFNKVLEEWPELKDLVSNEHLLYAIKSGVPRMVNRVMEVGNLSIDLNAYNYAEMLAHHDPDSKPRARMFDYIQSVYSQQTKAVTEAAASPARPSMHL
jgi:hypothetical protein